MARLKHGSLFSGIGGFDLAAQWAGWENVFQVEIDKKCQMILKKNFPNTARYSDIKQFNAHEYSGKIDIISGGFPCQPFSVAGQRRGQDDDRALWPEMLRVIREIRPTWVIGENVAGFINMGLDQALSDLENEGYQTEAYIIPAVSVGAWHLRERVWIVAHSDSIGRNHEQEEPVNAVPNRGRNNQTQEQERVFMQCRTCQSGIISDPNLSGRKEQRERVTTKAGRLEFDDWWKVEPAVGRVVDGLPGRVDRLKGLGNAIVPQVAYQIFSAINEYRHETISKMETVAGQSKQAKKY